MELRFSLERLKSIRLQSLSHHPSLWISSCKNSSRLAIALNWWSQEHRGFLFSIVWCSQTGDHPHEDLAKFGYGPAMKVKKRKRILLYFGNPTGTCSRDMADLIFFLLKSDVLWPFVCYRNPLHMWKLFFQVKKKWKFAARAKWQPGSEITLTEDGGWDCYPCSHALLEIEIAIAPHHVGGVVPRLQYPF